MSIHSMLLMAKFAGEGSSINKDSFMKYELFYFTRWTNRIKFCGIFNTVSLANAHVDFLQNKLPHGKKITFKIVG